MTWVWRSLFPKTGQMQGFNINTGLSTRSCIIRDSINGINELNMQRQMYDMG